MRRFIPSLVLAGVFAAMAWLWAVHNEVYEAVVMATGWAHNPAPFDDLHAVLLAGQCWGQGVDVYRANACMGGGNYNYSPLLLHVLRWLPGPAYTMPGGLWLDGLFIAATALLPAAETRAELWFRAACLCSSVTLHLLEPANLDTLLFAAVVVGLWLLARRNAAGWGGYALFLAAAALKYYPVILLALAARERLARLMGLAGAAVLLGGMFLWRFGHGTAVSLSILPYGLPFTNMFGAVNVPYAFGVVLLYFASPHGAGAAGAGQVTAAAQTTIGQIVALGSWGLIGAGWLIGAQCAGRYRVKLPGLTEFEQLCLVGGALVICFCFYATQNIDYRACFLLLTLPGLWRMGERWLLGAILFLLWDGLERHFAGFGGFYAAAAFWCFREFVWWFVVVRLTGLVFAFATEMLARRAAEWRGWRLAAP